MWGIRALQGDPPVRTGFDHLAKFCRFNRQEKLLSRKAHLAVVIRVKGFRLDRCLSRIRFLRSAYIVIANVCLEVIKRVFCLLTLRLMTLTSHTFGHHRSNAQKRARGYWIPELRREYDFMFLIKREEKNLPAQSSCVCRITMMDKVITVWFAIFFQAEPERRLK